MKIIKLKKFDQHDIYIWGISAALNDLKIVTFLNQNLPIVLARSFTIHNKKQLPLKGFATFLYNEEFYDNQNQYILIQNRSENYFLYDDYRIFDFFFCILGNIFNYEKQYVHKKLKKIPSLTALIELNSFKHKDIFLLYE